MVKIKKVSATSLLDSRNEKTILVTIKTNVGSFSASSPNGKSTGKNASKIYKKDLEGDIKTLKDFEVHEIEEKVYDSSESSLNNASSGWTEEIETIEVSELKEEATREKAVNREKIAPVIEKKEEKSEEKKEEVKEEKDSKEPSSSAKATEDKKEEKEAESSKLEAESDSPESK